MVPEVEKVLKRERRIKEASNTKDVGENDRIVVVVEAGQASSEALNDNMILNFVRDSLIKNTKELLRNGLGTSQLFLDENESVFRRFGRKKMIKVITITEILKRITENLYKIGNNNIMKERRGSANDMETRIIRNKRNDFFDVVNNLLRRSNKGLMNFPMNFSIVGMFVP